MRLPLALLALLPLAACASSFHGVEVRVLDQEGAGIAHATVENEETRRTADAAGRVLLEKDDAEADHWKISAPGYRTLIVDASPDALRLKQADGRLPQGDGADAVPLVFRLERLDGVNDPKKFEAKEK